MNIKNNTFYILAFLVISFFGYVLLIDKTLFFHELFVLQEHIDRDLKLSVLHLPSLLFILISWFVAHWLLDSNKAEYEANPKICYKALKQANLDMERFIEELKKQDISATQTVYEKLNSHENLLVNIFVELKKNGKLPEDFEFEIVRFARDSIHHLEERIQHVSFVSTVLPMLGMVGTLGGLMLMATQFSNTQSGDAANAMQNNFEAVGIALLTTLYASLITITMIKPKVQSYKNQLARLKTQCETSWQNGLCLYEKVEGYFFTIETKEERDQALYDAYPEQTQMMQSEQGPKGDE